MKTLESPRFEPKKEKAPEQEKEAKYYFEEIAELEKPMISLAEQLKEAIDRGEYDTLISDDAGGRIPTLVMREIMMTRLRKQHPDFTPEQEREALKTFFVAGGRTKNEKALKKFFKGLRPQVRNKALLVTEYIESGESIQNVGLPLENSGISFDVAASFISSSKSNLVYFYQKFYKDHKLYVGQEGSSVPGIYSMGKILGGVVKDTIEGGKAHPKKVVTGIPLFDQHTQADIIGARQDVDLMAKRILEKVWSDKDN